MERRLAAILAADVAGYSRAMGQDEAGTLAALSKLRQELIEPLVAEHRGRVFKLTGDGILAEFASVIDAVACAIAWQGGMAADGLQFRIGVNLGDVMHQDGDIYGNGVNVAARLEGLAEPGGICISGTVQGEVRGKLDLAFEDLGEQSVKNIAEPIRVWRVLLAKRNPVAEPSHARASLAVLSFTNMSGDPEQEYFSDGITDDIITELSRFAELLVIARNSSFTFKGKAVDVKEVGRTLGVAYVVEGSVRKSGNRVRITSQLISAEAGDHVWAERYDRDLKDIFEVQDEIAGTIASTVAGRVKLAALDRARRRPTENLSAYDYYLRAREGFAVYLHGDAEKFLLEAIRLDPRFALACAMLAMVQTAKFFLDDDFAHLDDALAFARKALTLDGDLAWSHLAMGHTLMFLPSRLTDAGPHLRRALSINPNDTFVRFVNALWTCYMGNLPEAIAEVEQGLRRDPFPLEVFWDVYGIVMTVAGRWEEALAAFNQMSTLPPWSPVYMAICYEALGQPDTAKAWLARASGRSSSSIARFLVGESFRDPAVIERFTGALRRLGMQDS
jgi:adenylate cyclase